VRDAEKVQATGRDEQGARIMHRDHAPAPRPSNLAARAATAHI
jgi:hypothetical protein